MPAHALDPDKIARLKIGDAGSVERDHLAFVHVTF